MKKKLLLALKTTFCLAFFLFESFFKHQALALSFETRFRQQIADGALDRLEFLQLQELALQLTDPEDYHFAQNLIVLLSHYQSFIQLNFGYVYQQKQKEVRFLFSPQFAENDRVKGSHSVELFSNISQQDILMETNADGERCGAAALLLAFYLLNGNLNRVFTQLNIPGSHLNYRRIHLAQEKLYHLANTDKKEGLTQKVVYQVEPNGKTKMIYHEGEIELAAQLIGLKVTPLKISEQPEGSERQTFIVNLWKKSPQTPLLVGVHLDIHSGELWPPNQTNHPENHFVLVFRQKNKVWLYNSGVTNNGLNEAMFELTAKDVKELLIQTPGSVNVVSK